MRIIDLNITRKLFGTFVSIRKYRTPAWGVQRVLYGRGRSINLGVWSLDLR